VFTGILEAALPVGEARRDGGLLRVSLDLTALDDWQSVKLGDSVALNGCCLTVAALNGATSTFEAIPETQRLTNLGALKTGSLVNVERAMKAGARLDGHIVQGHVDATATVASMVEAGGEVRVAIDCGEDFARQCIYKGSVCVDGISLTIAELTDTTFKVAIIPHTREATNIRQWKAGTQVNLEADLVGKYVRRHLDQARHASIDEDLLRRTGFVD
jgi:riboflavin synthase